MIEIIPFEPWHLELIDIQDEQKYIKTHLDSVGLSFEKYGEVLKNCAIKQFNGELCAWTYYKDGEILGTGGILQLAYPHVSQAWCIFGTNFKLCYKTAVKKIKSSLLEIPSLRIEAYTETDFIQAQRFLEYLGFQQEGILRKQGVDRRDNIIYSIIRD